MKHININYIVYLRILYNVGVKFYIKKLSPIIYISRNSFSFFPDGRTNMHILKSAIVRIIIPNSRVLNDNKDNSIDANSDVTLFLCTIPFADAQREGAPPKKRLLTLKKRRKNIIGMH